MSANPTSRPSSRGRSLRMGVALFVAASLPACTGDNLFTGVLVSGLGRPEVEITAPENNFTIAIGESVTVTANMNAPQGLAEARFFGLYSGGQVAFDTVPFLDLLGVPDTTLTLITRHDGTTPGNVRFIVEAVDVAGAEGADTVNIIVN